MRHGSLALAAGAPGSYTLKGLAAGTAYTVHATVTDAAGNVAVASPLVATATTAAAPSLTGMDWSQMTLDALCGEVVRLAQGLHRGAPLNARMQALVEAWPQRRRAYTPVELLEAVGLR